MKKILKCLLLVICFWGINTANARELYEGERFTKYYTDEEFVDGLKYYISSENKDVRYSNWSYRFSSNSDGADYIAYCMDPHKEDGDSYRIDRILGEYGSDLVKSHDIGIKKILELGYNAYTRNSSYQGVSGEVYYNATSIAIRAFMLGLYDWGTSAAYKQYKASAHVNLGIEWATEYASLATVASGKCSGTSDVRQCFLDAATTAYPTWFSADSKFEYSQGTQAATAIAAAKSLFYEGVKAAADFRENGNSSGNISYHVGKAVQDERDGDTVKEHIIIDFAVSNFDEEGVIHNFTISPTTNNAGITIDSMEYSTDGVNYQPLNSSVDIAQAIPAENGVRNGSIKIRVNITKVVNDNCSDMTFSINYRYKDPNISAWQGAVLRETNDPERQRFLIVTKIDQSEEQSGSISGITVACAKVICDTEISVPICSDDENEAISEITVPEDIKKCILDNVDDAGNSYQLSETNGGVDNAYCSVFCKEDYRDVIDDNKPGGIKLNPVVEDVECGSYFQLTSHIEGKKDCYTGGDGEGDSINREQFLVDIEEAQSAMVDAMNRYQEHYTKYLAAQNATEQGIGSCTCGGNSCGAMQRITVTWDTYDQWDFSFTNETASLNPTTGASGSESWEDSCNCDTGTSTGDEEPPEICGEPDGAAEDGLQAFSQEHEREYKQAEQDYKNAYDRYVNAIKDYNGCTAAWTMEFPFAQRLKYYYNEYHGTEVFTSYYDLVQAANNEDLYYLDAVEDSLIEESEVVICKGETDDEYNCQSEALTFDDSIETEADEWNYVEAFGSAVYSDRTYVVCSDPDEGCVTETQKISDATFIRKTIKKSQDYITPTVYYQIEANGRVTVNSGYSGNAFKLDAIKNSLPVSTSLTGGGIYKLLLEDLGEFYDTGETGRLIDFGGENEEKSVAAAIGEEGIETFDGEYICNYQSTCQDPDCPDCDFVCDEDECYWGDRGSCPDCEFECINCIFNMGELQINFKPITTVDVTAADREYGYNWDVSTTLQALELLRDKADVAIEQIQNANDTIYDDTKGDDGSSSLAFSIRMTADVINYLKDYNKSVEDEGGYANDSLTCYDATIDGKTYANIFCYSDVIDDLYENYQDQITVGSGRLSRGERYERDDGTNNANSNGYWSLWDWTEPTRDANGQYSVIGGPSWR